MKTVKAVILHRVFNCFGGGAENTVAQTMENQKSECFQSLIEFNSEIALHMRAPYSITMCS